MSEQLSVSAAQDAEFRASFTAQQQRDLARRLTTFLSQYSHLTDSFIIVCIHVFKHGSRTQYCTFITLFSLRKESQLLTDWLIRRSSSLKICGRHYPAPGRLCCRIFHIHKLQNYCWMILTKTGGTDHNVAFLERLNLWCI